MVGVGLRLFSLSVLAAFWGVQAALISKIYCRSNTAGVAVALDGTIWAYDPAAPIAAPALR